MKRVSLWFGLALGIGLCIFFLARLDWAAFWEHLKSLQGWPVSIMLATVTLSTLGRAVRWKLLAGGACWGGQGMVCGGTATLRLSQVWQAVLVGYLGNFIYPARAGEMLRMLYLHKTTGLQAGRVLTSSLFDRIADILMLIVCGTALVLLGASREDSARALYAMGGAAVVVLAGLAMLVRFHHLLRLTMRRLVSIHRFRWQSRCLQWCDQAIDGLALMRSPVVLACTAICSLGIVLMDIMTCWLLLTAFGWELPITAGIELVVFLGLGACLPAAPGYLGIYQTVSVLVLRNYGIPEAGALAYAFTLQLLLLAIFLILGGSFFWRKRTIFTHNS